jgi:hypothetical protein
MTILKVLRHFQQPVKWTGQLAGAIIAERYEQRR